MLGGCAPAPNECLKSFTDADPSPQAFHVSHGYGCKDETLIELSDAEWLRVRRAFQPPAANAIDERRQIAAAVATLELEVGARTGTTVHQRRSINPGDPSQLDCIDKSVNTWT